MKFSPTLAALAALPATSATIYFAGVAQSSGEFGAWSPTQTRGTGLPGRFGVDYAFISTSGVDTMIESHKVNLHRVAFLLERMCPVSYGLGAKFNETHFEHFKEAIDYITITKGAYAILDPHNYMRYNDPSSQSFSGSVIGNTSDPIAATTAQFAAFWGELASRFKTNEKVLFGLMNEPHSMPSRLVFSNLQAAITAIRATGANNMILTPGNAWSGGHYWTKGGDEANSKWIHKLVDPIKNLAVDIHEYLDEDFSGGHTACTQDPVANLAGVTGWLREHGLKGFVTEFGGSNTTECKLMLEGMLGYMEENEEYIGWTAWAAGPFWGVNSPCCTDQRQLGSLEPGSRAADGGPGLYDSVWVPVIAKRVPGRLQWDGPANVTGGVVRERV
ncbi:Putative Glycoside Hydrolase Family 5 [Podospora comata]|uniref:cellulase n=1 Tax=Podospora comata TaxID=48703 RepID=A0ABY6S338_PODCO|nr:Putative Glycoside Hydrolase Family 5 [Podospora comata]